ncbi:MAG: hypothetical protein KIS66_11155 [Fimbriimonadaceae bacterium]|nr:hypothetical protein [Fimbriimonadaceae bacterium]
MVYCSCGKPLDKVPKWLEGVTVTFVCNNCPNRDYQNIAHAKFPAELPVDGEAPAEPPKKSAVKK